jgi:ABC-2 type transport system permease protein
MSAMTLTAPAVAARHPGWPTALRWEVAKLSAQARGRYTLLGCLVAPIAIVLIFHAQQQVPSDTIFGRQVHLSGLSMPLFMLSFGSQWIFPVLAALVAGDIFAKEDQHGTWKTILTRSVSRSQIFWAKVLTAAGFTVVAMLVLAASTIASSVLIIGHQPLTGLSGQSIPFGHALGLVAAGWLSTLAPMLGITALAILFSVLTRNPAAGIASPVVIALALQLLDGLGGIDLLRKALITTPMEGWHGLFTQPRFYAPMSIGLAVSAGWIVVCLVWAYVSFRKRDITEG